MSATHVQTRPMTQQTGWKTRTTSKRTARRVSLTIRALFLAVASFISLVPLVYMVLIALTANSWSITDPWSVVTARKSFANFINVVQTADILRSIFTSLWVAVATTILVVFLSSMMAYAFARYDFPGKRLFFGLILVELMIPGIMLIIPQFILTSNLHLLDNPGGLLLVYVGTGLAFNTFLLRSFFIGVPRELDEAMLVDGANAWTRYFRLMLPLARPAVATTAVFTFLGSWDEYVWASTILNTPQNYTLPLNIALFQGSNSTNFGLVFAATTIAFVPSLIIFIIFQKQLVGGITAGALKA